MNCKRIPCLELERALLELAIIGCLQLVLTLGFDLQ
jgi:hypothetical protein